MSTELGLKIQQWLTPIFHRVEEPSSLLSHQQGVGVSFGWFWLVWIRHSLFPEFLSFGSTAEDKDQLHWHLSWASHWWSAQSRASFLSISVLQNATKEHIQQPVVLLGSQVWGLHPDIMVTVFSVYHTCHYTVRAQGLLPDNRELGRKSTSVWTDPGSA